MIEKITSSGAEVVFNRPYRLVLPFLEQL